MREQGFSLLEAIVALAILSIGAMAIYAWINTGLLTLQRVDAINRAVVNVDNAVEWVSALDPRQFPKGEIQLGEALVEWSFVPTEYRAPMLGQGGTRSVNDAHLMQVQIQVSQGERPLAQFQMWHLALSQERSVTDVLFD
ncbi:prepilin-type N-terminal cleavage/methylation domain-containing protein [Nitrincola tapanii]|uniref:Prepilin-type N-terminal cleavage/methylation domain-containing protein n=1 Tax=Nitrincola tapanii TaxID=1708751 RepID=A0A5A9W0Z1_9GAMM|nr:prepilin-type N-terminal cleavage/methylation domain-containing protein [Nitrincola tapanii]KAA0874387.1 prepilin-type N-terminal cleavage/methylation domain-containing protein [Nitrincola tapanii]